jgi:hypothetical protein
MSDPMQKYRNLNAPQTPRNDDLFAPQSRASVPAGHPSAAGVPTGGIPSSLTPQLTRDSARQAAEQSAPTRCAQILRLLQDQPRTLWEIAQRLGVHEHQISGRLTELTKLGKITPTAMTRPNPRTGQSATVYTLSPEQSPIDHSAAMGYPDYLSLPSFVVPPSGGPSAPGLDRYQRDGGSDQDGIPGVSYSRRDTPDGPANIRQAIRVALIPCPHCGATLKKIGQIEINGKPTSQFRCGARTPNCQLTYTIQLPQVPGGPTIPVLVATTL